MGSGANGVAETLAGRVHDLLAAALPAGGTAAVAYSGGTDSTVLLGVARHHGLPDVRLQAVHVNHHLSPQAPGWVAHCRRRCRRWDVGLTVVDAPVTAPGTGLENRARQARLAAFRGLAVDALLLAHHADDQAETVLMRLLRGAGARGMGAMRPLARLPGGRQQVLRPFLGHGRDELAAVARAMRVRGVTDPANADGRHNRNWLRHEILPALAARFPGARQALQAAAANAACCERLLHDLATLDEQAAQVSGGISRARLVRLGPERVGNWLACAVARSGGEALGGRHLRELVRQLGAARGDVRLAVGTLRLECRRGILRWVPGTHC